MTKQTFFQELQRLLDRYPKQETRVFYSENCNYSDHVFASKNLAYCFDTSSSSDSVYLFDCHLVANSQDCDYTVESESCYEGVDLYKCFNCYYSADMDNTRDAMYCNNISNCHDIFGCCNLKNKSYCIFNRQYSQEEYERLLPKYKALQPSQVLSVVEELQSRYPITQSISERNVNSPYGNFHYDSKNCYMVFDSSRNEDSGYLYDTFDCKHSYDLTYAAKGCEYAYQIVDSPTCYNSQFVVNSANCQDSWYLFNCKGVKNSIGCVNLQYKEYCILNRQFSKEEYEKISAIILPQLTDKDNNWDSLTV